jgi:hypothetical protein
VAILGRKNGELYATIEMKSNLNELQKHLTIKGYTHRAKFRDFFVELFFRPLYYICLLCEYLFPPLDFKKKL